MLGEDEEASAVAVDGPYLLTRKRQVILIDEADYATLRKYTWRLKPQRQTHYAIANVNGVDTYMHRLILGLAHGDPRVGDHINGRGWDNRRANLRICTDTENKANRVPSRTSVTGYTGVYPTANGKFLARIRLSGVRTHIGLYDTAEDAARAYDKAAIQHRGIFVTLNFPEEHVNE